MIKRQTVFILGAGSSAPYGFPVGMKLVEQLSWQEGDDNWFIQNYERDLRRASGICEDAERLQIVYDDLDESPFKRAQELIEEAELVVFLGVGFHPINLRNLGFGDKESNPKFVGGTTYGLTDQEKRLALRDFFSLSQSEASIASTKHSGFRRFRCREWLRQNREVFEKGQFVRDF